MSKGISFAEDPSVQICSVKMSQFDAPLTESGDIRIRYSPEEKLMRSRHMVRSPFLTTRQVSERIAHERRLQSQQNKKLSFFLEGEINNLRWSKERMSNISDLTKGKITELRTIMRMKSLSMRESKIKGPIFCHFTELRLNQEDSSNQGSSLLHARNTKNSPFTRGVKAKKLISKSVELKKPESAQDNQFKSIEVGSQSKYGKIKKMILVGGALRSQLSHTPSPQSRSYIVSRQNKTSKVQGSTIRRLKKHELAHQLQECQNDCRPWQIQKGESHFELSEVH